MKIDVTQKLLSPQNTALLFGNEDATLRSVMVHALIQVDDAAIGMEGFIRGQLAHKIFNAEKEVELSAEEITKIKELIGKIFGPLYIYAAWNLIEKK